MTNAIVRVTQRHLERGLRYSSISCPIALALRDNGYPEANVYGRTWNPTEPTMLESQGAIRLPQDAVDFIHAFDNRMSNDDLRPKTFLLPLP